MKGAEPAPFFSTMPLPPPDAEQIFLRAQAAWTARVQPAYVAFTLPCDATYLAPSCAPNVRVRFVVRMMDGRTYARTVAQPDSPAKMLVRGAYITGPADAPLGFVRSVSTGSAAPSPPPNLAADPLRTIASVTAIDYAYGVRNLGEETVGGIEAFHLELTPLRKPDLYPLRELWVSVDSYQIIRLVYVRPFQRTTARITYDFAQVGTPAIWTIVHIAASTPHESVSESLDEIAFPASEPDALFEEQPSMPRSAPGTSSRVATSEHTISPSSRSARPTAFVRPPEAASFTRKRG